MLFPIGEVLNDPVNGFTANVMLLVSSVVSCVGQYQKLFDGPYIYSQCHTPDPVLPFRDREFLATVVILTFHP